MIVPLLLGAGLAAGVLLIAAGLWPPKPSLADELAALHAPPPASAGSASTGTVSAGSVTSDSGGWAARMAAPTVPVLAGLGLPRRSVRADLAVLGRPATLHLAEQAATALAGLFLPPLVAGSLALAGVSVGWVLPLWVALALAIGGFLLPDLAIHADADRRRAEFRHALSSYLDLVVVSLAGGAGVQAALHTSAQVGTGWANARIRDALQEAALTPQLTPWQALGRLGTELGITDLTELAATVSLAGTEGAKIRTSLRARATALRGHLLADLDAAGASATERMSIGVVALFAAFLLFLAYPAVSHVLTGL
ncbi:type II secretion system F family protein [Cryptosporangium phraense]|uniref:Secretion system protein n=1 Tax=Cryptosporangium phraense TaxID=2593070 RepID=A0A545ANG3_9ACTN|nr:type II secretion system F family protein [Cryptosporangium phraense]TQS42810.1 secretion system protein [Cryptosporangium phraense]